MNSMTSPLALVGKANNDSRPLLAVSGEDASGKPFKEKAPIIHLLGRDCTYESRTRLSPGASLMIEIASLGLGPPWRAAAIVEAVTAVENLDGVFHVAVVLGRAYEPSASVGERISGPASASASQRGGTSPSPVKGVRSTAALAGGPTDPRPTQAELDKFVAVLLPTLQRMVRETVQAEYESKMAELQGSLAVQIERAVEASVAELTQFAKDLPAINERLIRDAVEESSKQDVTRTTAALEPAIAEMVRLAVATESARQAAELKRSLSQEIEAAIQTPLQVMSRYAESIPALDEETVRTLLAKAAEVEFGRAVGAFRPAVAEILRQAVAAEYGSQTAQLKKDVEDEVRRAVRGLVPDSRRNPQSEENG